MFYTKGNVKILVPDIDAFENVHKLTLLSKVFPYLL